MSGLPIKGSKHRQKQHQAHPQSWMPSLAAMWCTSEHPWCGLDFPPRKFYVDLDLLIITNYQNKKQTKSDSKILRISQLDAFAFLKPLEMYSRKASSLIVRQDFLPSIREKYFGSFTTPESSETLKLKVFGATFQRSRNDSLSNLAWCGICWASSCPEVCTSPCNSLGRSLLLGLAMASTQRRWWTSSTTFVSGNRYNRLLKTDRDSSVRPHSISWKANLRGFEMLSRMSAASSWGAWPGEASACFDIVRPR